MLLLTYPLLFRVAILTVFIPASFRIVAVVIVTKHLELIRCFHYVLLVIPPFILDTLIISHLLALVNTPNQLFV